MTKALNVPILNVANGAAILLGVVVVVYAIRLLVVGEARGVVPETPVESAGQPPEVVRVEYVSYLPAIVPLVAAGVLLGGLFTRKLLVAWTGLVVLSIFSVLFLFSSGATLLPGVALLLILLTIITLASRSRAPRNLDDRV